MTIVYISLFGIFIGWYVVNFVLDLTRKDPEELMKKQEDEDIDISDEVRQFQPVLIEKEQKKQQRAEGINPMSDTPAASQQEPANPPSSKTVSDHVDEEPSNRKSISDIDVNKDKDKTSDVVAGRDNKETKEVTLNIGEEAKGKNESKPKPSRQNIVLDTKPRIRTPDTSSEGGAKRSDKAVVRINDGSLLNLTGIGEAENINTDLPMIRIDMEEGGSDTHYVGAIKADDLPALISEIAEKDKDSRMGRIFAAWEVCEQEKDAEDIRRASEERRSKGGSPPPLVMPSLPGKG